MLAPSPNQISAGSSLSPSARSCSWHKLSCDALIHAPSPFTQIIAYSILPERDRFAPTTLSISDVSMPCLFRLHFLTVVLKTFESHPLTDGRHFNPSGADFIISGSASICAWTAPLNLVTPQLATTRHKHCGELLASWWLPVGSQPVLGVLRAS